jgi:hypothetical protein
MYKYSFPPPRIFASWTLDSIKCVFLNSYLTAEGKAWIIYVKARFLVHIDNTAYYKHDGMCLSLVRCTIVHIYLLGSNHAFICELAYNARLLEHSLAILQESVKFSGKIKWGGVIMPHDNIT